MNEQVTTRQVTERVDARTEQDGTACPDQASVLGEDFYYIERAER